jgi:ribosomal protein L37AE/L43A
LSAGERTSVGATAKPITSMKTYEMYCPNCGTVYRKRGPQRSKTSGWICVFCLNVFDKGQDHFLIQLGRKPA